MVNKGSPAFTSLPTRTKILATIPAMWVPSEMFSVLASTRPEPATDVENGDCAASETGGADGGGLSPQTTVKTAKATPASATNGMTYLRNIVGPMTDPAVHFPGSAVFRSE